MAIVNTLSRRRFCTRSALLLVGGALRNWAALAQSGARETLMVDVAAIDRARILLAAEQYLRQPPMTITQIPAPRSAGGRHDYFSEGDYWWPDPKNPTGPYIQRDGMTNPDNFTGHRHALIRFSVQVGALAAAWKITRDPRYAAHALRHLRAWFLDPETLMNPNLQYAQAIFGRSTGRGIGIIDTIHLVEVARGVSALQGASGFFEVEYDGVCGWFDDYLAWITTSPHGLDERESKNNHGTCWVMQVAEFARLTGDDELIKDCRERFKTVLVPNQIAPDGSFPLELKRTKPYGYSLFNLDAMATVCQILSTPEDNLWTLDLPDGRGIRKAMAFMFPYIKDKKKWPYPPDVMYFDQWPVRQPSLLFAGLAFRQSSYLQLWSSLNPDPTTEEGLRNFPVRQPVLWVS